MRSRKCLFLFLAVLLAAGGCTAAGDAVTEEAVPSQMETTAPITEEPPETTASSSAPEEIESKEDEVSLEELFANSTYNYRELNKPKETENPTMAEQIYKTLYDFADFYNYRFYYMAFFVDRNDVISVERIAGRSNRDLEDSPELFGRQNREKYYRVTGGRITTAKEYFYRLCQCVSDHYLADGDRDGFETAFQLSDGNLYLTEYALNYCPRTPASSTLDKITQIDEDRLLLSFTAETRSLKPEIDDTVYTEQYTVTMRYEHDRWKVDECTISGMERLWNEIIQGGTAGADPKTDLPGQIERCLKESGNEPPVSAETEESVPETDGEALLAEYLKTARNFREENMPPETENPTLAEEIYRLLYDFADLNHYLYYCLPESRYGFVYDPETGGRRYLLPENDDFITADNAWINPAAGSEDENFVLCYPIQYSRVRYGEIKTADEYYRRMSRVATWEYMALDCPWLGGRLQSSGGNLYVSDFEQTMNGANSDSVLNKITKIDEDTLRLEFTATYYYAETRIETEDYSVTISRGKSDCRDGEPDGKWRIDRCDSVHADDLSCEMIRGGINGESPKTDLPGQIERCLKESGLM